MANNPPPAGDEVTASIVLLSGPPGAGKSTVAQQLIALMPGQVAYIEGDTFWRFFTKGFEIPGRRKNFKTVVTSILMAAIPYARAGYTTIVDFPIPPWALKTANTLAQTRHVQLNYIVLYPTEEVCAKRAATRAEGIIDDYTVFKELYASFADAERHIISNDLADAVMLAAYIQEALTEGRFRI